MYAKIFEQIFDSSIAEDWKTRLVFEDLLVLADQNGVVDKTYEAIARRTNVPLDIVTQAIKVLESPDERSRNPAHEGRRILRLDEHRDWGWMIVNYDEYRKMASEEQRRQKTLERVRKYREKKESVTPCNASLRKCNDSPYASASASVSASSPEGGCKGGKTFKQWDEEDLAASVKDANADGILDANQVKRFIEYWSEPMASGRPRMSAQKAWYTKRRLRTWADRNESNTPTPAPRKKEAEIRKSRDMVLMDAVDALEAADKQGGDVGRCLQALGDKFRDYGKNRDGLTVAGEAYEVFKYRKKGAK